MISFVVFINIINSIAIQESIVPFERQETLSFSNIEDRNRYSTFSIAKNNHGKSKSFRVIFAPNERLKSFLHCVNIYLTRDYYKPDSNVFGFIKGKSIVDNAQVHIGKKIVINLDLKDFFPSISMQRAIQEITRQYSKFLDVRVIEIIVKSSCVKDNGNVFLAQGSPLSPLISNIVCNKLDYQLNSLLIFTNASYSRYADDITFSTDILNNEQINDFILAIKKIIQENEFCVNDKKTRIQTSFYNQSVTGLTVNKLPNLKKSFIKDLRNILFIWKSHGYPSAHHRFQKYYRKVKGIPREKSVTVPRVEDVIRGKLSFLRLVKGLNDPQYKRFINLFNHLMEVDKHLVSSYVPNLIKCSDFIRDFKQAIDFNVKVDEDGMNYCNLGFFDKLLIPSFIPNQLANIQNFDEKTYNALLQVFFIRSINKKNYKWVLTCADNYNNEAWNSTLLKRACVKIGLKEFYNGNFNSGANLLRLAIENGNQSFIDRYLFACYCSNQKTNFIPDSLELLPQSQYSKILLKYAYLYHSYGFVVYPIYGKSDEDVSFKVKPKNVEISNDQTNANIDNLSWSSATGIGLNLGINNYRCLDIDNVYDAVCGHEERKCFIAQTLHLLNLPQNYPWVTLSGSGKGFHIIFKTQTIEGYNPETLVFSSNKKFSIKYNCLPFERMELRWSSFLVMPPSLHHTGNFYKFREKEVPLSPPSFVTIGNLNTLLDFFCGSTIYKSFSFKKFQFSLAYRVKRQDSIESGSSGTYIEKNSISMSVQWLKNCNTPESLNELGIYYLLGEGVKQNADEAIRCFETAQNTISYFNIASLIACGLINGDISLKDRFKFCLNKCKDYIEKDHIDHLEMNAKKTFLELQLNINNEKDTTSIAHYIFFDTETTGLLQEYYSPLDNSDNFPRLVQLSWIVTDKNGVRLKSENHIIFPVDFSIPSSASEIHGITNEIAKKKGESIDLVLNSFLADVKNSEAIVGHNINFDLKIVEAELIRLKNDWYKEIKQKEIFCTMKASTKYCKIPGMDGYKWPKLQELHEILFNTSFKDAHNSTADVEATFKCFWRLKQLGVM